MGLREIFLSNPDIIRRVFKQLRNKERKVLSEHFGLRLKDMQIKRRKS